MTAGASWWLDEDKADATAVLAMQDEQSRLLELAEQVGHVGLWRVSLPDYTIKWSNKVYDIHGVTPDCYTPDIATAIAFYHPDDRDHVTTAVTTAEREGTPFEYALRLIRADGTLRYVKSRGLTIPGPNGKPALILGVLVDVTEQQTANHRLEHFAYVDALTRLANRRQFDDILEREWRRAIREQTPLSLIMLDIDRFKSFNDLYGHLAGDNCLRIVAAAIAGVMHRAGDLAARYGGEEFALILPTTEAAGAEKVAHEVRSALLTLRLNHAGNALCGGVVTASLGVATAYPQSGGPPTAWLDLIAEADALLYEGKRTGRNKVVSPTSIEYDGTPPLPANEEARLTALAVYEQAGATQRSAELDRIARLAATLTSAPIGLVSLVGRNDQHFPGRYGLEGVESTPRDVSFCAHTILGDDPLIVPDATRDTRFEESPLVTGDLGLRYYAGAPIISMITGHRLGAVCVVDTAARAETTPAQRALLTDLAKMAAMLLDEKAASPGAA